MVPPIRNPAILISAFVLALIFVFNARTRSPSQGPYTNSHPDYSEAHDATSIPIDRLKHVEGLPPVLPPNSQIPTTHPIDDLIKSADITLQRLLKTDVVNDDVGEAAKLYRGKRKRHPPPGFDRWFEYARSKDAIIIETMFDQIYHDLEPFWSLDPAQMRQQAVDWPFAFSIRDGKVRQRASRPVAGEWLQLWESMFKDIVQFLPDVDIAINNLDEPRMIVPWEDMEKHMKDALATRSRKKPANKEDIIGTYPTRDALSFKKEDIATTGQAKDGPWLSTETFWSLARKACRPKSKARGTNVDDDLKIPAEFPEDFPPGSDGGYVSNFTSSKSVCEHSHLRNLHGTFVKPRFVSVNTTLFPLFAGCKIADISNEILLPAAKYFSSEAEFSFTGDDSSWESKKDSMFWRGQATGGAHTKDNWTRFHRHRFVAMTNGSEVALEEDRRDNQIIPADHAPPTNKQEDLTTQHLEVKGAFAGVEVPDPPERPHYDAEVSDDEDETIDSDQRHSNVPESTYHVPPRNIPLPPKGKNPYHLSSLEPSPSIMSAWLSNKTDIGFDHLMCDPWGWSILGEGKSCGYLDPYYHVLPRVEMSEMYSHKYLPDIDGNSYSGRYLAFLRSGSLPIKSTIWSEWFDSRIVPWKHFVPIDNTFVDLWGVQEYFWGYGVDGNSDGNEYDYAKEEKDSDFHGGESVDPSLYKKSHDAQAKRIAEEGRDWANRVLRRDDMLVYVYRLVLEYARIVSEDREKMGWVDDLF